MSEIDYIGPAVSVGDDLHHCPGCACRLDYPDEEAMAAIAAACTCANCMTGGRCVEDQPEDSSDEDECPVCPPDCQTCSETPDYDCPTHGGEDADS